MPPRYSHTNLVARDSRRLAAFHFDVFGCEPVPPERDLEGAWLDHATGLRSAHVRGVHLRLPARRPRPDARGVRLSLDPEGNVLELQAWG